MIDGTESNSERLPVPNGVAHFAGVLIAFDHGAGTFDVESDLGRRTQHHVARRRVFAARVISAQQRVLQRERPAFALRPVQQPMRIGTCSRRAFACRIRDRHRRALAYQCLPLGQFGGTRAVLARDVCGDLLALGRQVRIQLERLRFNVDLHRIAQARDSLLERLQPDRAPGAGHVGNKVDLHAQRLLLGWQPTRISVVRPLAPARAGAGAAVASPTRRARARPPAARTHSAIRAPRPSGASGGSWSASA